MTFLTLIQGHKLDHRAVMTGFPDMPGDSVRSQLQVLYRVDGDNTLIQSAVTPCYDWFKPGVCQTKEIDLSQIGEGSYRVRLAINPVVTRSGRRYPCDPVEWLSKRADRIGFTVEPASVSTERNSDKSGSNRVPVVRATVDGILTVTDAAAAVAAITQGIGKSRAYGCGLISLAGV